MRAWLYDRLTTDTTLRDSLGGVEGIKTRVIPRQSQGNIIIKKPFLMYGLGNATSLQLSDSTANDSLAERQFFQVWIHDEGGSYENIDSLYIPAVKARLVGQSPPGYITVGYLETSQEFSNETYNTIFRYLRFEAIKGKATT